MALPFLVTIHGIRTCGRWQEDIAPIFRPHFRYVAIKYDHYLRFGALKIAGYIINQKRIVKARKHFVAELKKWCGAASSLNVIAHSLGTRIIIDALDDQKSLQFNDVILTGCVLPRKLDWAIYSSNGRKAINRVRNETGKRDMVARLAAFAPSWLRLRLGDAGHSGFEGKDGHVHTLDGPYQPCTCGAYVHNVSGLYEHSGVFETRQHALYFWLPWLLKLDITEYRSYIDECDSLGGKLQQDGTEPLAHEALTAVDELGFTTWKWLSGSTLRERLVQEISQLYSQTPEIAQGLVNRAIIMICVSIHTAMNEMREFSPSEKTLEVFDPIRGLRRAAKEIRK